MLVGSATVLGPQATSLAALALPMQLLGSVGPVVALSQEDREMLGSVRYMLDVLHVAQGVSGPPHRAACGAAAPGAVCPALHAGIRGGGPVASGADLRPVHVLALNSSTAASQPGQ
jgi:hypothetical protein